jgi:alkaline phosphatase
MKNLSILATTLFLIHYLTVSGVSAGDTAQGKSAPQHLVTKHIILIIGDGMHLEHERAASRYLYGDDFALAWHSFPVQYPVSTWDITTYNRHALCAGMDDYKPDKFNPLLGYNPHKGGIMPYPKDTSGSDLYFLTKLPLENPADNDSLELPATDSAASATAMATGHKTENKKIGVLSDNTRLATIAELMRSERRAGIGIVSTMPFSHATPASFVSHNESRYNLYTGYKDYTGMGIADEIITVTKPDVVISGGHPLYSNPDGDSDMGFISYALYNSLLNSPDYVFVERQADADGALSLEKGVQNALAEGKKLFALFGGAGGYSEPALAQSIPDNPSFIPVTKENPKLADSASAALAYLSRDNDGFFLLIEQGDVDTANHENDYRSMIASMFDLEHAVRAVISFVDQPDDSIDWSNTLLIVTADHANSYMRIRKPESMTRGILPFQKQEGGYWAYPDNDVVYRTFTHTNELVMAYAKGEGSALFRKHSGKLYPESAIIDNTAIYEVMREAAQISAGGD